MTYHSGTYNVARGQHFDQYCSGELLVVNMDSLEPLSDDSAVFESVAIATAAVSVVCAVLLQHPHGLGWHGDWHGPGWHGDWQQTSWENKSTCIHNISTGHMPGLPGRRWGVRGRKMVKFRALRTHSRGGRERRGMGPHTMLG